MDPNPEQRLVRIAAGRVLLEGNLSLPEGACGIVLFAHGSGSSRFSQRNRHVAELLNREKLATLLVDLLSPEEEAVDLRTAELRFNIGLLAERLVGVTDWLARQPDTRALRIGYFGASTGVLPPRSWRRQSVPGATHLFEEPGALDQVARLAREWFERYLAREEAPQLDRRSKEVKQHDRQTE